MAAAAILKNHKNRDFSATVWPIFTKFGLVRWCKTRPLTTPTIKKLEFHKSKMADGGHFENVKIAISLQPLGRFWRNLSRWRTLAPYSGCTVTISNFWKSKMAATAILKNHKNRDISATVWPIFTKFDMLVQNGSLNKTANINTKNCSITLTSRRCDGA